LRNTQVKEMYPEMIAAAREEGEKDAETFTYANAMEEHHVRFCYVRFCHARLYHAMLVSWRSIWGRSPISSARFAA
jgi:rubrerythrin